MACRYMQNDDYWGFLGTIIINYDKDPFPHSLLSTIITTEIRLGRRRGIATSKHDTDTKKVDEDFIQSLSPHVPKNKDFHTLNL